MSKGCKYVRWAGCLLLSVIFTGAATSTGWADTTHSQHKTKKPTPPPPPLPSGPTGPLQAIPLDSMAPTPPQVSFENGQLTIVAPNSTLSDILKAVRKQTNAEIEIPAANDRVVTRIGPGPAREVLSELLNGSRFNYVLLGSPDDSASLTRVILVPKTGDGGANSNPNQPSNMQAGNMAQPIPPSVPDAFPEDQSTGTDDANEDNAPEPPPAAADADQQQQDQNVKTPQQMLQEMQQRQMQMQQQMQNGQNPAGGRPPQEQ